MASPSSFVTPVRPPRSSRGGNSSGRRSSLLGDAGGSDLTPSGAQILHAGLRRSGRAIALQVLGLFRYVADPALRRVLPARAMVDLHRDVFDVLLSDGQVKVKALLSPSLNDLVWCEQMSELDVVEIDDYEAITTADKRTVCIIHDLTPRKKPTRPSDPGTPQIATPRAKIVYTATANSHSPSLSTSATIPELQFISTNHIRDHGAVPLTGDRLYYLSLLSDDYPVDWEAVACEALSPVGSVVPWAEWNRRRRYCTDVFASKDRVIRTIREANLMTSKRKREDDDGRATDSVKEEEQQQAPPPMIGIVHFKSALTHLGNPDISNDFPFMFQIVLSDRERSVEIAFFGSMAAKHFLVIQEGDVIHVQNYTIDRSATHHRGDKPKKLFLFPHLSNGIVSHVPEKFWRLLEITEVLPQRATFSADEDQPQPSAQQKSLQSTVWLEPTLVTVQHAQEWDLSDREEQASTYFDFVGVVSFVGRVHRHRLADDNDSVASVRAYRWVKVVDASCAVEMVIRVYVSSQPTAFHGIQAGDIAMFTKLQWIDARDTETNDGLEFATTSSFSCIRLNDAVEPFLVFRECVDVFEFAKELQSSESGVKTQYSAVDSPLVATTESWLEGRSVYQLQPSNPALSMAKTVPLALAMLSEGATGDDSKTHWVPEFYPTMSVARSEVTHGTGYSFPFDQVAEVCESMDALSHRYLRVHVHLHDIRIINMTDVELLVSGGGDDRLPQPVRVRPSLLFKESELPKPLDDVVAIDAESLVRVLSSSAITALNTAAMLRSTELPQFSPAKKTPSDTVPVVAADPRAITVATVKEYVLNHRDAHGGIDLALHLYRLPHGQVDLWVDAISI